MEKLKSILNNSLSKDGGFSICIEGKIQDVSIWIVDSRTMYLYGIGRKNTPGYSLKISVTTKSNTGQKIESELLTNVPTKEYVVSNTDSETTFVRDYMADIQKLILDLGKILSELRNYREEGRLNYKFSNTNGIFRIEETTYNTN